MMRPMRRLFLFAATALVGVACHGNDPAKEPVPPGTAAPARAAEPQPHGAVTDVKTPLAAGACAEIAAPETFDPKVLATHCDVVKKAQLDYLTKWVSPAR